MRLPLVQRGVRCVDCGFLERQWLYFTGSGHTSRRKELKLKERSALRDGAVASGLEDLSCHLGVIDIGRLAESRCEQAWQEDGHGVQQATPEYGRAVAAEAIAG